MRRAKVNRKTHETNIQVVLNIDGKGKSKIKTPIGLLTHILESFAKHGIFDISLTAEGDLHVDQHHILEDIGLVLGQAFNKALGNKKGINRAGYFVYPMDESLVVVSVDIGGRPYLQYDVKFKRRSCGEFDTDVLEDFFYGFSVGAGANIAVRVFHGRSDHHKIEAIFKAFGKAMKTACSKNRCILHELPSTKGLIEI